MFACVCVYVEDLWAGVQSFLTLAVPMPEGLLYKSMGHITEWFVHSYHTVSDLAPLRVNFRDQKQEPVLCGEAYDPLPAESGWKQVFIFPNLSHDILLINLCKTSANLTDITEQEHTQKWTDERTQWLYLLSSPVPNNLSFKGLLNETEACKPSNKQSMTSVTFDWSTSCFLKRPASTKKCDDSSLIIGKQHTMELSQIKNSRHH